MSTLVGVTSCCQSHRKMGYIDGKTDADLLIEEDDVVEDEERVFVLKVRRHGNWYLVMYSPASRSAPCPCCSHTVKGLRK